VPTRRDRNSARPTEPGCVGTWRVLGNVALAFTLACVGFVCAAHIASSAGVAEGQGLASGAIVLGYALLGALGGLLAGWALLRLLPAGPRRWLTLASVPVAVAMAVLIAMGWLHYRAEMDRHLQQAYADMPHFQLELQPGPAVGGVSPQRLVADSGERWLEVSSDGRACRAALSGEQTMLLLSALREAELVVHREPEVCKGSQGPVVRHLVFVIQEATAPTTQVNLRITADCLASNPALDAPARAAAGVVGRQRELQRCLSRSTH